MIPDPETDRFCVVLRHRAEKSPAALPDVIRASAVNLSQQMKRSIERRGKGVVALLPQLVSLLLRLSGSLFRRRCVPQVKKQLGTD